MSRLPISVCIIAKNEEKYIGQCLRHLLPYEMEIVVADTGSTDKTKEIAFKYTDKVFDYPWNDDFGAARNFAASKASNPWILTIDCDEYLKKMDIPAVRICMQQHLHHVGNIQIKNLGTNENGEKTYHTDDIPRFYNRNFYEYYFRIHEQITPRKHEEGSEVVICSYRLPVLVEHHGYDLPPEEMAAKQERNLRLLQSSLGEDEIDDYLYFQMAQSYQLLNRKEEALDAINKCFALNPNPTRGYMKIAVPMYAKMLRDAGKSREGMEHLLKYAGTIKSAQLSYQLGCCYQECGENLQALLTFVKITQRKDIDTLGENAYDTYVRIIKLHYASGNQEGVAHFKQRLEEYGLAHGRKIVFE